MFVDAIKRALLAMLKIYSDVDDSVAHLHKILNSSSKLARRKFVLIVPLLKRNLFPYRMPGDLLLPAGWIARRSIGQANLRQRQSNIKMTNMENSDSMATAIISDTSPIPSNHCNGFRYLPILCSVIWLQFSHSPCFTDQLAIARAGCFSVG
ncbi:hypothetical protein T03_4649 [Trichinella britovi]|uniref:Uncharacterized protein n=1 Tax=Trichinella britovi TaxID=45882 RepID=A0A0V1CGZ7_TRIBR|nr:hypothetical protein T03_4649 [Trichinella britovi]